MVALDLDGTLLDYSPEGQEPRVNPVALSALSAALNRRPRQVAILTNQGGLPWWAMGVLRRDGRPYPSPEQFLRRLDFACCALSEQRIAVVAVRVSIYHPKAAPAVQRAARLVRAGLNDMEQAGRRYYRWASWRVYTTAAARKPNPLMLRSVGATEYWGDSPEDAQAAANAGIPFVKVERFL